MDLSDAAAGSSASASQHAALQRAKLDAMKELAYGASHEINNPLANIAARAQALLLEEASPERRRSLEAIRRQAMRAHDMISDLMLFARPPQLQRRAVDLPAICRQTVDERRSGAALCGVKLTFVAPSSFPAATLDPLQIAAALGALVDNSLEAAVEGGRIEVVLAGGDEGSAIIEVRDDGTGLTSEAADKALDPFYSGREAGRGLGFGLSKAWRIVTDHGGELTLARGPERGAIARIRLPSGPSSGDP